ncbi:MAG: hypothetical protein OXU61_04950 [Gammaproteobacteria bacterium]|nr:hypothetical protein [Gammaproteobacteria bacterium]
MGSESPEVPDRSRARACDGALRWRRSSGPGNPLPGADCLVRMCGGPGWT